MGNHEKGFGVFKVPKSGAGRVWRRFNAHLINFLLLRCVGKHEMDFQGGNWQVPRKAQNEAWGGV